jgi:hypothetical protein
MSLRIARNGSVRSTLLFIVAIVLAVAMWPLVMRVADQLTGGLGTPPAATQKK